MMDIMDSLAKCCRAQQLLWSLTFAMIDQFSSRDYSVWKFEVFCASYCTHTPHTRESLYFVLVICPQPSTGYN